MKIDKVILSIFLSDEKVVRLSINKALVVLVAVLIVAPYVYISKNIISNSVAHRETHAQENAPLKNIKMVEVKPPKLESKVANKPVVQSRDVENSYKFSNLQVTSNGKAFAIDFLLSKKLADSKTKSGLIYLEVLDKDLKTVATSSKSAFKFTTARISKFNLDLPVEAKIEKIKFHIIDSSNEVAKETSTVLNVPVRQSL